MTKQDQHHSRGLESSDHKKKWNNASRLTALRMSLEECGEVEIAAKVGRKTHSVKDAVWRIATNYLNQGRELVRYVESKKLFWDRSHKKWTKRENKFLIDWRNKDLSSDSTTPLDFEELGVLLGRTADAIEMQLQVLFKRMDSLGLTEEKDHRVPIDRGLLKEMSVGMIAGQLRPHRKELVREAVKIVFSK
jgi:hypothetical protein